MSSNRETDPAVAAAADEIIALLSQSPKNWEITRDADSVTIAYTRTPRERVVVFVDDETDQMWMSKSWCWDLEAGESSYEDMPFDAVKAARFLVGWRFVEPAGDRPTSSGGHP